MRTYKSDSLYACEAVHIISYPHHGSVFLCSNIGVPPSFCFLYQCVTKLKGDKMGSLLPLAAFAHRKTGSPMLTGYYSPIHGAFWLNPNPLPYLLPIPAVLHPPSVSMMSAGHRVARKRSRKLCLNECTRQPSGTGYMVQ